MADIITRIHAALPALRQWIDDQLEQHATQAQPVSSRGYKRLAQTYPAGLLNQSKIVTVPRVPFPPVDRMDLPEFGQIQRMQFGGITFLDTFFVSDGAESEALCFHELVHIVQWARLGPDNFLLAYGLGIIQAGYENSPLEKMAYTLQHNFEQGTPQPDIVVDIQRSTDVIWTQAAPIVRPQHYK